MKVKDAGLPDFFVQCYTKFPNLTPIQAKAVSAGLLNGKSLLVTAPTGSGKTLVATMAISKILAGKELTGRKCIYLVPLKALANEKFKEFKQFLVGTEFKVTMAVGDVDSDNSHLGDHDLLILTTEKFDSLLRHKVNWLNEVKLVAVDEIHLLNDPTRGPTLEIILTLLKSLIKPQIIGLSATIGNPKTLADWLEADLVQDDWRPVELKKGIYLDNHLEFY